MGVFHMHVLHTSFPIILATHLQLLVINVSQMTGCWWHTVCLCCCV